MTLIEALRSHRGGLVRIKSDLFWYDGRGWDGVHDRICLLMDSDDADLLTFELRAARTTAPAAAADTVALLLVDGQPHWVWVGADDMELLQPGCNPEWAVV
jgi:hypothetical protein